MGEYADDAIDAGMEELGYNGLSLPRRSRILPTGYRKVHIQKNPGISFSHFLKWHETNSSGYEPFDLAEAAWMEASKRVCSILNKPVPATCSDDEFTSWWDELGRKNPEQLTQASTWLAWQEATKRANAR